MPDLFKELIPSILQTKVDYLESEEDEKGYPAFMVNRAIGHYKDCVLFANEMNLYPQLPKKMQYDYLIYTIRSWKRPYARWQKKDASPEDFELVKAHYGYSNEKAREALRVLTPDQIMEIRKRTDKGGADGKPRKPSRNNARGKR